MKTCTKCGVTKALEEFSVHVTCVGGRHTHCKKCMRDNAKRHNKSHYVKNTTIQTTVTEKLCSKCSTVKTAAEFPLKFYNKDGLGSYCRACDRTIKREKYDSKQAADYRRLRLERDPVTLRLRQMITSAKIRAKQRKLPFDLDLAFMRTVYNEFCPVLGFRLNYAANAARADSPTLDKFIPSLGYIKGNVTIISRRANTMKQDASLDEVRSLLNWMHFVAITTAEKDRAESNSTTTTGATI